MLREFERLYFVVTRVGLLNTLHNRPIVFLPLRSTFKGAWVKKLCLNTFILFIYYFFFGFNI